MIGSFIKQNKNKKYNYTPRYYDERKERLNNLKIKHGLIEDESDGKSYRRTNFRDDWKQNSKIQSNNNGRLRLLVIFIFLLMASYVILTRTNILNYI